MPVDVLTEGVHSGDASGVVPSSFLIMRQLLARREDMETGKRLTACISRILFDQFNSGRS